MRLIKKYISLIIIKLIGWRIEGALPHNVNKVVLLGVPHTSAYDFPMMILSAWYYQLRIKWVGKENLFKPMLLGIGSRLMGGICVERSTSTNSVERIAQTLNNFPGKLCLVIAPNGSRKNIKGWRTGFYHIAKAADIPIALGFLDYGKKILGIKHTLVPSGNMESDFKTISTHYEGVTGKQPHINCPIKIMPPKEKK
jgi:1-acyl-sn-glycerol-3-phosphate acyltransferase